MNQQGMEHQIPVLSVAKVEESTVSAGVKESFFSRVPSRVSACKAARVPIVIYCRSEFALFDGLMARCCQLLTGIEAIQQGPLWIVDPLELGPC